MTKRPKTGRSRLGVGTLASFLGNRRIGIKLGFIMFVPTLATVIVGANGLVSQISNANTADRAHTLAVLSADAGTLAQTLQDERADATKLLGYMARPDKLSKAGKDAISAANADYRAQQIKTAQAQTAYAQQAAAEPNLPATLRATLASVDNSLSLLPGLRVQINTGSVQAPTAATQYQSTILALVAIRDGSAQLVGDPTLSFEVRAAAAISRAKEYVAEQRETGLEALLAGTMSADLRSDFIGGVIGEAQQKDQFTVLATPDENALYTSTVSADAKGPSQDDVKKFQQTSGDAVPTGLTVDAWDTAMTARTALYRTVETAIDNEIVSDSSALRDSVERQIIIDVGLLFGIVLIAMLIAWFVARSMNRSLRELKHGALTVARQGLPQAVARLRDPSIATQLSPQQIALQIAEPLPVRTRDEFGEVTEAFNAVHIEAVRTAAEQAVLRSSVATMFVNLARRSQILVDRLIGHLDRLERGEEDPDRLAELFQLDHLATRMRRNDENLLVLAGADSTRVQREPAPLVDVLRAAQSEVEHYTRVDFGSIDRDLEIASHAVNDLVHLVAELLDNATAFSPPDSPVLIEARRFGDRAVLYVEDRGIGISADQLTDLNDRLAKPPLVDVAVSRMMGLVVVARLAARHGIEVKLRPAPDRGTVADVLLPPGVLVNHAAMFRGTPAAVGAERAALGASEPHRPPPRSPFGPPLALESGPSSPQPISAGSGNTSGYAGAGYGGSADFGGFASSAEQFGSNRPALLGPGVSSRALPSWSDLTGATIAGGALGAAAHGAVNGVGGYPGGPNGGYNGHHNGANGNGPQGYGGIPASPLPRRSPQSPDDPRGFDDTPYGPGDAGPGPFESSSFQRGPFDAEPESQWPERPRVPRQRPRAFESLNEARMAEEFADAELVDDGRSHPPVDRDAMVTRLDDRPGPSSAPPAWPPVVGTTPEHVEFGRSGHGNGESLDMTAEIPRFRDLDLASALRSEANETFGDFATSASQRDADEYAGMGQAPRSGPPAPEVMPFADETMELPIFRALESAWFATSGASGRSITGGGRPADVATVDASARQTVATQAAWSEPRPAERRPGQGHVPDPRQAPSRPTQPVGPPRGRADNYSETTGGNQMAGSGAPAGRPEWHTHADEGWLAAAAASEPADGGTTPGGLPRRVPLAQLVPGSVERTTTGSNRRSPDAVRGLLSAYHRGVQRGRQQNTDDVNASPESTTSGRPAPGGKEQDR